MLTDAKLSTRDAVRGLALVIGAVWLVALLLALFGLIEPSTAAGLAVGSVAGAALGGAGVWIGLRRAEASEADTTRLDALEPLPPRER